MNDSTDFGPLVILRACTAAEIAASYRALVTRLAAYANPTAAPAARAAFIADATELAVAGDLVVELADCLRDLHVAQNAAQRECWERWAS